MTGEPLRVPFVNVPASISRAERMELSGEYEDNREGVLHLLAQRGLEGATWRELGEAMGLHHGQISGLLSSMHARGDVFALRLTRNRCHPYVHEQWRDEFTRDERMDEPVKTAARQNREIAEAARRLVAEFRPFAGMPLTAAFHREYAALVALLEGGENE